MIGSVTASDPAIEVRALRKRYGELRGGAPHRHHGRPRRGIRPARAQRRRQDHHGGDPGGLSRAHRRRGVGARPRSGQALDRAAPTHRHSAAVGRHLQPHHAARGARALGELLSAPARGRRGAGAGRAGRAGGRAQPQAVGRAAAPAGLRAGARWRPRADLPGRADHRLRSGRPPRRVGDRARPARAGQDDPADHPLPRRGTGAGRPRGDRQGRAHPGDRAAAGIGSPPARLTTAWPTATATAG